MTIDKSKAVMIEIEEDVRYKLQYLKIRKKLNNYTEVISYLLNKSREVKNGKIER